MKTILTAATAVAALSLAMPAFAQSTTSSTPGQATPPAATADTEAATTTSDTNDATSGTTADSAVDPATPAPAATAVAPSATAAGANASVTTGMPVKDKTGAAIGSIADVKADGGKTMATIKMGAETFAVDAANLGVADGSATINATHAEIQQMLKK